MASGKGVKRIELTGKRIALSDDDRYQMSTLSAEIEERLTEMGKIMRRIGAMSAEPAARWVIEFSNINEDTSSSPAVILPLAATGKKIVQVCSEVGNCGCYEEPPGICYVGCFSGG
jgi:hypothetical protein